MFGTSKCVLYREVLLLCALFSMSFIRGSAVLTVKFPTDNMMGKVFSKVLIPHAPLLIGADKLCHSLDYFQGNSSYSELIDTTLWPLAPAGWKHYSACP